MTKRKDMVAKRREVLVGRKLVKHKENRNENLGVSDLFDHEGVLSNDLKSIGVTGGYYHFISCDSTNNILKKVSHGILQLDYQTNGSHLKPPSSIENLEDWLLQWLARAALPCVITASEQTAGRGRHSNTWWTGTGSLALSMLLDAKQHGLEPQTSAQLSLVIGYAAMQALRTIMAETALESGTVTIPNVEIRWPNDVYVNDCKMTGILIEMPNTHHVIIGVGINTNNSVVDAPEELRNKVVTLSDVMGQKIDQDRLIFLLCREIMEILFNFPLHLPQVIEKVEANLYQTGKMVNIASGSEQISGKCLGLNPNGSLRVLTETGEKAVVSGVTV